MKKSLAIAAVASVAFSAPAFSADFVQPEPEPYYPFRPGVEIGLLTCDLVDYDYFFVGSRHHLACVFKSPTGQRVEGYTGSINHIGVDLGPVTSGTLIWGVIAPKWSQRPGALEGNYGGLSAGAALGWGGQANVLLGGFERSIALQPISFEGTTGANITAALTGMRLISNQ
ncbi:hypothetical protein GCM10007094_19070 [Pseudovibrio japonicus]|uniref:DUF992 domain-containing protein n=1 Tax=Pseudovibrio japonicus TaxID=366534 RepID=A0ABQ3E9X8_9HYPH|nr:DUF992 domain-containing protein [Pseudovibrio japonicus]GHB30820.1 hypothetical protein GCM10007094_19070 [Pseudovibrio japonicus]